MAYTSVGINRGMGFAYFAVDTYELMGRCVFTTEGQAGLQAIRFVVFVVSTP
jgi:hypothetical protein